MDRINKNNFLLKKIKLLYTTFPLVYLTSLAAVFLFVFPIFIKFLIRSNSNFYSIKKEIETAIINENYAIFKKEFSTIFMQRSGLDIEFYEAYLDPPFNLIKKINSIELGTQEVLLSQIYTQKSEIEGELIGEQFIDPEID